MSKRVASVLVLAVLAVAVTAIGPAAGATSVARQCATGGTTLVASSTARVFRRGKSSGTRLVYACALHGKKIVRLNEKGEFGFSGVSGFVLTGHYLAYNEAVPTGAASETGIVVRDLRTGKIARQSNATSDDYDFDALVAKRIVLTPRGTIAWTVLDCVAGSQGACDGPGPTLHAVLASDGPTTGKAHSADVRVLARAPTLSLTSIALAADAKTVYWTVGATPAGAPIH